MIRSEKRMLKNILRLVRRTTDSVWYDQNSSRLYLVAKPEDSEKYVDIQEDEALLVLQNLAQYGLITIYGTPLEVYISVTYQGLHHKAYSFDRLKKIFFSRFLYGLVTGILTGALSTLLAQYLLHLLFPGNGI